MSGPSLRKPGFLGQRMVDKGDEPQTARVRHDRLFEAGQGEAVDNRRGPVAKGREHTPIGGRRELDKPDGAPSGTKAFDNMPVVQIPAGQLIEPVRDDEDELLIISRLQGGEPGQLTLGP